MRGFPWLFVVAYLALAGCTNPGGSSSSSSSSGGETGDAGAGLDAAQPPDAAGPTDAAMVPDAALPPDAAMPSDAAVPRDAAVPPDAAVPRDAAVMTDAAVTTDAAPPADGGTITTLEECCTQLGCADDATTAQCQTFPSAYSTCSVNGTAGVCMDTAWCGGNYVNTAGFCPGAANIQCCTPPGTTFMCSPTDHPYPNAGIEPVTIHAGCPPGMMLLNGYCMDVFEGFLRELLPDGGVTEWSPYFNPGTRTMVAVSAAGAVPQGYINADQAEAACQAAGKRLCTNTEWLQACRGAQNRIYPYGNTRMDGVCNDARSQHPAVELFPNDPTPFDRIQEPCINQLPNSLDPAGANSGCVTPEGVLDLMGNLHEWTSDPAGTFRGGFYVDTRINGEGCLYATTAHDRSHWDYSTGFRCCAAPL